MHACLSACSTSPLMMHPEPEAYIHEDSNHIHAQSLVCALPSSSTPPCPFPFRKRHWGQLMEVTGQNFDMDPKTFTLGNMFSMQLHKYAEEIGKITNAAVKVGLFWVLISCTGPLPALH